MHLWEKCVFSIRKIKLQLTEQFQFIKRLETSKDTYVQYLKKKSDISTYTTLNTRQIFVVHSCHCSMCTSHLNNMYLI